MHLGAIFLSGGNRFPREWSRGKGAWGEKKSLSPTKRGKSLFRKRKRSPIRRPSGKYRDLSKKKRPSKLVADGKMEKMTRKPFTKHKKKEGDWSPAASRRDRHRPVRKGERRGSKLLSFREVTNEKRATNFSGPSPNERGRNAPSAEIAHRKEGILREKRKTTTRKNRKPKKTGHAPVQGKREGSKGGGGKGNGPSIPGVGRGFPCHQKTKRKGD